MPNEDLRLTAVNLTTGVLCTTDIPLPQELAQGTYPFPPEERYQVAFEPNGENVAEVLLVNSSASSMRIGTTTVDNAIGPRLRPYYLDSDPRIALRQYIDAMYECVANDNCSQLGTSVNTTDLEALGMIIDFAYQLRPWGDKSAIANDISWVLLGTSGAVTPLFEHVPTLINQVDPESDFLRTLASALQTPDHPFSGLGGLGQDCSQGAAFSQHYGDGQCNQIYHFWSYFTSFTHFSWTTLSPIYDPYHIGIVADISHECIGVGGAGSPTDARLSTAAWELAIDSAVIPANLAVSVIAMLSTQRPQGFDGNLAWWYYHIPECNTLASDDWSDRHPGETIPSCLLERSCIQYP